MLWNIPWKPMQPSSWPELHGVSIKWHSSVKRKQRLTNHTIREEQYTHIFFSAKWSFKKKSKLLPDARLGDLLTLCQITKYIYHLFFYGKFENFTYNLFQIHIRFCHCLFYNSINNYPIKPPKSGYNNYNRFMMIGGFFLSVCCIHANEM